MATSSEPKKEASEENQLSIKVTGDLQDVHITEEDLEETESDDDEDTSCYGVNALSTLPQGLEKPTYGNVQVTDSENVHFGDKITGDNIVFNFKGPVVIKQVVHSKEQDNPGYEQTEDDTPTTRPKKTESNEESKKKPSNLLWLKLALSAIGIVIVGAICAIVGLTLTFTQEKVTSDDQDTSTDWEVEGMGLNDLTLDMLYLPLFLVIIIYTCFKLLKTCTQKRGNDNAAVTGKTYRERAKQRDSYRVKDDPLLIAPTHLRIVSRTEWLAQPVEQPLDKVRLPVPWVIIQHTATESCNAQSECILSVRLIQMFHVESRGWFDIGYNFLVAGDGSAYYGRGWENQGAHTLGYNRYSMGIAFIGTFNNEPPPKKQLDACKKLIQRGVELGKIAKDYKLFAHRQLASTLSPGDKLFEILKEWPHFVQNGTDIDALLPDY